MPYMRAKGYCCNCERPVMHHFSLEVKCLHCGLKSTQKEYNEAEEKYKEEMEKKNAND